MLDIKFIRENLEEVKETASFKGCRVDFDKLLSLDEKRRSLLQKVEEKKSFRNKANDEISQLKKEKKDFQAKIKKMKIVSGEIKKLDTEITSLEKEFQEAVEAVPNIVRKEVPRGKDAKANVLIKEWGDKKTFSFKAKDHLAISDVTGYLDFPRAAKTTGSGFSLYRGEGAKLERALINFMIDFHTKNHGYEEVSPPFLVNRDAMVGTGQIPKMEEDMYLIEKDGF